MLFSFYTFHLANSRLINFVLHLFLSQYLLITNLKKKLELKQMRQLSKDMLSPSYEIHFIPRKAGSCLNRGAGYSITFGLIGGVVGHALHWHVMNT
jgi:hypothetical protein